MDVIYFSTRGVYKELSNFYPSQIFLEGKWWPTVEHFYQARKTDFPETQEYIRSIEKPIEAKKFARSIPIRSDWERIKEDVMLQALRAKFSIPELREILLSTGDAIIHENSQYDDYWGTKGLNRLGKLLMQVRDEIKETDR